MKELINKTQQKIYVIWRKAKQHISSFIVFHLTDFETNIVFIRINIKVCGKKKEKEH